MDSPDVAGTTARSLLAVTPPEWARRQLDAAADLLVDQAHLEKKAAAAAVNFLFRVPLEPRWQRGLSALAREELVHFERTLRLLAARGLPFANQPATDYAARLKRGAASVMPERLVDELLVAAIIEARSCERMGLLATAFAERDPELAGFYGELVEAEARHEVLYFDLACAIMTVAEVEARWRTMVAHEAEVLRGLPFARRLHGGLG
ncbi:MAG: tRNA-(ms[2]io[6]A)-hydroxylase [Planctomycetes bacterium]|nr:tRNA-(ms[2]io[6]A)-hydroxylase [Planctomycetota bacterium]